MFFLSSSCLPLYLQGTDQASCLVLRVPSPLLFLLLFETITDCVAQADLEHGNPTASASEHWDS